MNVPHLLPPPRPLDRPGRAIGALLLALVLLIPVRGALAQPQATAERIPAERLVFLLQYIAVDYAAAVQDGAIVNPFEYREMRAFSQRLVDQLDGLQASGVSEQTRSGLVQLQEKIRATRPQAEVRALASDLAAGLARELDVSVLPTAAPDLDRGRRSYAQLCASCHGTRGEGDGPAAAGMDPPPTSFGDSRMDLVSRHQLYGAIRFGIEGTAMPSYQGELDPEAIWDLAFFVKTLRSEASPRPERELPPARADRSAGPRPEPSPGSDLQVALRLQGAFASVAEQAGPSVVGVMGLVRQADAGPPSTEGAGAWREGSLEERLYPGFRPARSGSGFLVSDDGYILTAHQLLTDDAGDLVEVVDVELHSGRHRIARIVGTEPTINLGVLQLEQLPGTSVPRLHPARIGESEAVRVGYWAIALGNPAGPGTSFAVGTLSSRPERQCYQEELTATLMQTSLSVPPGGYGGPLLNIEGEVVGMMVPGPGADLPELVALSRPLGFALPIDLVMAIYEPLKTQESRRSPWLGFSVLELRAARRRLVSSRDGVDPTPDGVAVRRRPASQRRGVRVPQIGVYIDDVFEPSPAAAADVRIGDRLISIDGNRLLSVSEFQKWLYLSGIGRTITLAILRDGEILEKRVTVAERPEAVRPR